MTLSSEETSQTKNRDQALDATRTVAIVLMIACHVSRLISKKIRPDWMEFCMLIEPLCQGLFLAMVGVSLTYSKHLFQQKNRSGWKRKQFKRGLELYGIALLFFFSQHGWQWPYLFINSGILMTIALSIVMWTILLSRSIPFWGLLTIGLTLFGIDHLLEAVEFQSAFINSGAGPFFTHCVLSSYGVIAGALLIKGNSKQLSFLVITMILFAGISLSQHTFTELFSYPFGRKDFSLVYFKASSGPEQLWKIASGIELKRTTKFYYNYRVGLAPMLMAMCTGVYLFFRILRPITSLLSPLWLIGKHSLGIYILHLIIIALITIIVGKVRYFTTPMGINGCFFCITLVCYIYAWAKTRAKRKL
jgi:uncharacterized membrane protein